MLSADAVCDIGSGVITMILALNENQPFSACLLGLFFTFECTFLQVRQIYAAL
jgi:hypothetical protein